MDAQDLFRPGETAWTVVEAAHARLLVDGRDYFATLRSALEQAEHAIYIAGWMVEGTTRLSPDAAPSEQAPLEPLLRSLIARRRGLRVFVLVWDPTASAGLGAGFRPIFLRNWRQTRRLRFRYDDRVPLGGSHHQKFVVVDDAWAFVGGFDLTEGRWDTPEHRADDPRRTDDGGQAYGPFHDAQALVDGDAARALGRLFRERWNRCGRRSVRQPPPTARPWPPATVGHEVPACCLALSRTDAVADPPIQENRALWLAAIAAARRCLYVENQYLTSREIGHALAERLREPDGPEVVIVGPRQPAGWLEEVSVGLLRWRVMDELRAADRHGRLRLYYPMASVAGDVATYVHAKLLVVDDRLVRVGSTNIARRSLGLDSELDLSLLVPDEEPARARVRGLRAALVAEHLGRPAKEVEAAIEHLGSVGAAIESLRGGDRTLIPFGTGPLREERELAQDGDVLLDPAEPVGLGALTDAALGSEARRSLRERLPLGFFGVLATCVALGAYRLALWTPGRGLSGVAEWAEARRAVPEGLALLGSIATGACTIGIPVFAVVLAFTLTLGALWGGVLSYLGVLGGSLASYGIGALLGRRWARTLLGLDVSLLSRRMMRRGLLSVALLRLLPIAAFPAVGIVAGAARVRLRSYLAGSIAGAIPYVGALTALGIVLRDWLRDPHSIADFAVLAAVTVTLWLIVDRVNRALHARGVREARQRGGRLA